VPVNFQTGDAMALPYDSDSFDIGKLIKPVFSWQVTLSIIFMLLLTG
jgi:hypothetical protein